MPAIAKTAKVVVTPDGGLTKINTVYTFATEANIKTPAKAHETVTVLPAEFEDAATIKLSSPLMAIASPVKTLAIRPKPKKSRKKESKLPKAPLPEALPDSVRHDLERKLGRIFYNPELLWEALQASANNVTQIGDLKIDDGNKKLAFLGDAVVKTTLLADWLRSGESRRMFPSFIIEYYFQLFKVVESLDIKLMQSRKQDKDMSSLSLLAIIRTSIRLAARLVLNHLSTPNTLSFLPKLCLPLSRVRL
jgi:hypothetical protein